MPPNPTRLHRWLYMELGNVGVLGALVAVLAFLSFLAMLISATWFSEPAFEPLYGPGYEEPQPISATLMQPGESFTVMATKCAKERVLVTGTRVWRRLEPTTIYIANGGGSVIREPGCKDERYTHTIPLDMPAGTWVMVGAEEAYADGDKQNIGWATEPFEVR